MCKVRCPACRKGICEIIATAEGRAVIVLKCPHCGRIVLSGKLKMDAIVKLKQCGRKYTVGILSNYCLCILHIGRNSRPPMRIKTQAV